MLHPTNQLYLLRWRFDFADKPSKFGMWSLPATRDEDKASFVNLNGLVRAAIEGKNVVTREIKTLAECDYHDFVVFEWNAALVGGMNIAKGGQHHLVGLKLVTRDFELNTFPSGDVSVVRRSEDHKKINFAAFGR